MTKANNETPEAPAAKIEPAAAPLLMHLLAFKKRVIYSFAALMVGFALCYGFAPDIYAFLVRPLAEATQGEGRRLIYTGLTEAFMTYLKLAFWGGLLLSFPFIATQMWLFAAPGLYRQEKRAFFPFLIATPVLFIAGAALAYYLVFPAAWHFFLSFEEPARNGGLPIQLEARVSEYLSIAMTLIFAFGLAFQMPVLLILLARAGLVTSQKLIKMRRLAIVLIFVAAAILTPPDVFSQCALAIPMLVLYEISIIGAKAVEKKKRRGLESSEVIE